MSFILNIQVIVRRDPSNGQKRRSYHRSYHTIPYHTGAACLRYDSVTTRVLGHRVACFRGGWGKLAGGVKWPPPPVRHLTKVNEMAVVSGHLSSLEVTRSKISKSCPL